MRDKEKEEKEFPVKKSCPKKFILYGLMMAYNKYIGFLFVNELSAPVQNLR